MKKKLLIIGIIFWCLVIICVIALVVVSMRGGWQFNMESKLVKEENISLADAEKISVESSALGIVVVASETDQLKIEQFGSSRTTEEELFQVSRSGSSIQIKQKPKMRIISLNFSFDERLIVHLPEAYAGDLNLHNSSGAIKIEDSFAWKDLNLKNSSGGVKILEDIAAENLMIHITSGGLNAQGALTVMKNAELRSSSGGIKVENSLKAESLTAKCTSGGMRFGSVEAKEFDFTCSSGATKVEALAGGGNIKSTSGGVNVGIREMSDDITIKSSSGGVKIDIAEEVAFQFDGKATSGGIRTNFPINGDASDSHKTAVVGENPAVSLKATATSGGVTVNRE